MRTRSDRPGRASPIRPGRRRLRCWCWGDGVGGWVGGRADGLILDPGRSPHPPHPLLLPPRQPARSPAPGILPLILSSSPARLAGLCAAWVSGGRRRNPSPSRLPLAGAHRRRVHPLRGGRPRPLRGRLTSPRSIDGREGEQESNNFGGDGD